MKAEWKWLCVFVVRGGRFFGFSPLSALFANEYARGFSFCLPAPTAEKMATDVFFRDGSTIKEALVAFLMRHVNFIKRGAERRRGEAPRAAVAAES